MHFKSIAFTIFISDTIKLILYYSMVYLYGLHLFYIFILIFFNLLTHTRRLGLIRLVTPNKLSLTFVISISK